MNACQEQPGSCPPIDTVCSHPQRILICSCAAAAVSDVLAAAAAAPASDAALLSLEGRVGVAVGGARSRDGEGGLGALVLHSQRWGGRQGCGVRGAAIGRVALIPSAAFFTKRDTRQQLWQVLACAAAAAAAAA